MFPPHDAAQYAEVLNVATCGVFPSTLVASDEPLDTAELCTAAVSIDEAIVIGLV